VRKISLGKPGAVPRFGTPTTANSRRPLSLSPDLVAILRDWRTTQNAERHALGTDYTTYNLVFTIPAGGPVDVDNLRRRDFLRPAASAGVPKMRLHDFRHGFASLLLEAGFDLKLVSSLVGHSTISTTAAVVYGHLALGPKREAANVIGRLLRVAGTT